MAKLRLGSLADDKPVKISLELPANVHRDLVRYAAALANETGEAQVSPERLISPMLERFMAGDRAFARHRNGKASRQPS
ncbi:DUF2274 domain-containing protein [Sphingobium sp. Leaf26]|uniref:DUF2274 domain-containing protein n=1 Tax=Sphingobium sp. Leaf26 TaxID=1735693 RepID=UPI0009E8EB40|nr:DUF2274 domain-containing protein [Sphingobium sp. Leaf26]